MERLRQERLKRELSQETLANRIGISRTTIAQYENGTRRPTGDIAVRLARELGVSSAYLLGATDNPERDDRLPEDWEAVVEEALSQGFSPADVRRALRLLRVALGKEDAPGGH